MIMDPRSNADLNLAAPLARAHPVAKLGASTVLAFGLLLSVDTISSAIALLGEMLFLPWCGIRLGALLKRLSWLLLGAIPAAFAALVFGDGPPLIALAVGLRILAIGLPGVILLATTDPTDLADGLAQVLHFPAKFTLSFLAALRLFGVLMEEWRLLSLARRARGLGGGSMWARLRLGFGLIFSFLVLAIRRATTLATAMEARGFGTNRPRSWARPSRLRAADYGLLLGAISLTGVAIAAAIFLGSWNLVLA